MKNILNEIISYIPYNPIVSNNLFNQHRKDWNINNNCVFYINNGKNIINTSFNKCKYKLVLYPNYYIKKKFKIGKRYKSIMLELAKAVNPSVKWELSPNKYCCQSFNQKHYYFNIYCNNIETYFVYQIDGRDAIIFDSYKLYNILDKYHIDYKSLINRKLAISVDRFKHNPYNVLTR